MKKNKPDFTEKTDFIEEEIEYWKGLSSPDSARRLVEFTEYVGRSTLSNELLKNQEIRDELAAATRLK